MRNAFLFIIALGGTFLFGNCTALTFGLGCNAETYTGDVPCESLLTTGSAYIAYGCIGLTWIVFFWAQFRLEKRFPFAMLLQVVLIIMSFYFLSLVASELD